MLARFAAAEAGPPLLLSATPPVYAKVAVTGRLRNGLTARFGAMLQDGRMGTHLVVPMDLDDGTIVLIDRGWVPSEPQAPIDQPDGLVTVIGFVHPPDQAGPFSAPDDVVSRQFYTLDPAAIGAALGLKSVVPFVVVAVGNPPPARWPTPAKQLPRPPNNHLAYAVTWYGLAIALVIIFIVWARKDSRP